MLSLSSLAVIAQTIVAWDVGWVPWLVAAVALALGAWVALLRAQVRRQGERLRAVEESESRFRLLFERSPDAVMLFETARGTFVDCNDAALRLLRCEKSWPLGQHPWDLAPPVQPDGTASREKAAQIIARAQAQGSIRFEWQHARGDGIDFPAEISLTSVDVGSQPMLLAVLHDVTAWKKAQTALEQANFSLEKRVCERTAELANANAHLKIAEIELRRALDVERELSQLKSSFVSMVSHEFRTPLGIISSSAQILDRYFERLASEDRTEHVRAIHAATTRMAAMMENVLALSRMDSRRMHFNPAPLALEEFCRALLDELHSATSAERRIELDWAADLPAAAQADAQLLRHIFSNLLSNAVKYSPPDRAARFAVRRDDFCGVFTVSDEGIGIPVEDQARLFHTFHRGSNVGSVAGTGLGLVIAKRCTELHSGEIAFESAVGRGTTFTVRLPIFQTTTLSLSESSAA